MCSQFINFSAEIVMRLSRSNVAQWVIWRSCKNTQWSKCSMNHCTLMAIFYGFCPKSFRLVVIYFDGHLPQLNPVESLQSKAINRWIRQKALSSNSYYNTELSVEISFPPFSGRLNRCDYESLNLTESIVSDQIISWASDAHEVRLLMESIVSGQFIPETSAAAQG